MIRMIRLMDRENDCEGIYMADYAADKNEVQDAIFGIKENFAQDENWDYELLMTRLHDDGLIGDFVKLELDCDLYA